MEVNYGGRSRVERITLNRPERLNVVAQDMAREIREAVRRAEADDEVPVIALDGTGRALCLWSRRLPNSGRPG
jgi:enoyl-CoA hydratase/carnithine racemase